jgi:hypothetical protein
MSTPQNLFMSIAPEELVTATGGVTGSGQLQRRDLWQLKHAISDVSTGQQASAATQQQGLMFGLFAALAIRNRG